MNLSVNVNETMSHNTFPNFSYLQVNVSLRNIPSYILAVMETMADTNKIKISQSVK